MAMSINTNVISINAQRNLGLSGGSLATSMQRLSSGLRVNSAKDDAAGLAIAERMNAQAKGLAVAARNANDGISLAQTAEGALGKVGDMLQRMRELAVQSSNATNSANDRKALQAEVDQLRSEIDRVAKTTTFNGKHLLNGSFSGGVFQVGSQAGDNITVGDITNAKADALGSYNYGKSTSAAVDPALVTGIGSEIKEGTLKIRVGTNAALSLGKIDVANTGAERMGQVVAAINAKTADTGVTAFLQESKKTAGSFELELRSASGDSVSLEGFNIAQTGFGGAVTVGVAEADVTDFVADRKALVDLKDLDADAMAAMFVENLDSSPTLLPAVAELDDLEAYFTGKDGEEHFTAALATFKSTVLGALEDKVTDPAETTRDFVLTEEGLATVKKAIVDLTAAADMAMWKNGEDAREEVYTELDVVMNTTADDFDTDLGTLIGKLDAVGVPASIQTILGEITIDADTATPEQLKDAKNQVMGLIDDYMSGKLGVNAKTEAKQQSGIDKLDISSQAGAWEALQQIDSAIDQVNAARGDLGALQTRFEKSVENIDIMNENVSAARGRIVDADFAIETANLSRTQILQQAGTAMVAQANQLTQNVLSLLR